MRTTTFFATSTLVLSSFTSAQSWTPDWAFSGVPRISGFTVQWSDAFTGPANTLPSTSNWIIDTGTSYPGGPAQWGTGEIETYTSSTSNVALDGNGHLAITPQVDASGAWTSGRIESVRGDFVCPENGKMIVQASISLPNIAASQSQGLWPAFWMLGTGYRTDTASWPAVGEFDIMENVNGLDQVYGTLHCGTDPNGVCNEPTGIGSTLPCSGSTCQGSFHTYSIEVDNTADPQTITWSLDGVAYQTLNANTLGAATWAAAVEDTKFILFNVAVGGGWPGNPNSATVGGVPMLVDYVAVYYSS